jgi:uncharacterized zinc-type alcohol dehydrogenase-like protein
MRTRGYAITNPGDSLRVISYDLPDLGEMEVRIWVTHCGICHSDLQVAGNSAGCFPVVPGHEVIGLITATGGSVTHLSVGQRVGVGWQCGACFCCEWCSHGLEQHCPAARATCDGNYGGFAEYVQVDSRFAFPVPDALSSEHAAPLMCAGLTSYVGLSSNVFAGAKIAVLGIGGLGHLSLQYAKILNLEVTAISSDPSKRADALAYGASDFILVQDLPNAHSRFDFLLSTLPVQLELGLLLNCLRPRGKICFVGLPAGSMSLSVSELVDQSKTICGSLTGSRADMEKTLTLAATHGISSGVQLRPMSAAAQGLDDLRAGRIRYRIVLYNDGFPS